MVVHADGNDILVEVQRQSACGQCAANKGCGTAVLQKVLGNRRTRLPVLSNLPVHAGDEVVVGLEEEAFLKGSFAVYLVPLIFVFVFGWLGETLGAQLFLNSGDAISIAFAFTGFVAGALWLRRLNASVKHNPAYQPTILRLVNAVPAKREVLASRVY